MARPIWKGSISFGLVNVPVVLYSAEERKELKFKMLDSRNRAPVKYERKNAKTGEEVPWNEIVKGYDTGDGRYVLLGDEDFKKAAVEATQTIDIQDFVNTAEVSPVYFETPYYLPPGTKGEKGYVLLRETLRRSKKIGIAKVVIRTREYLSALMVQDDALILELLRFHDELRDISQFDFPGRNLAEYKVSMKEIELAEKLVSSMSAKWKPDHYHDDYKDALLKWIEHKAESGETMPAPAGTTHEEAIEEGRTINIMDLLKQSVEKTAKTQPHAERASKSRAKAGHERPHHPSKGTRRKHAG